MGLAPAVPAGKGVYGVCACAAACGGRGLEAASRRARALLPCGLKSAPPTSAPAAGRPPSCDWLVEKGLQRTSSGLQRTSSGVLWGASSLKGRPSFSMADSAANVELYALDRAIVRRDKGIPHCQLSPDQSAGPIAPVCGHPGCDNTPHGAPISIRSTTGPEGRVRSPKVSRRRREQFGGHRWVEKRQLAPTLLQHAAGNPRPEIAQGVRWRPLAPQVHHLRWCVPQPAAQTRPLRSHARRQRLVTALR